MPKVRLLADAVGRYDATKGDVIEVSDREAARWIEGGAVEKVGKATRSAKPEPEAPAAESPTETPAEEPKAKPKRRRTKKAS